MCNVISAILFELVGRSIKQQMQLKRLLNTDMKELEGSSSLEREMSSKKFDRKLN